MIVATVALAVVVVVLVLGLLLQSHQVITDARTRVDTSMEATLKVVTEVMRAVPTANVPAFTATPTDAEVDNQFGQEIERDPDLEDFWPGDAD